MGNYIFAIYLLIGLMVSGASCAINDIKYSDISDEDPVVVYFTVFILVLFWPFLLGYNIIILLTKRKS